MLVLCWISFRQAALYARWSASERVHRKWRSIWRLVRRAVTTSEQAINWMAYCRALTCAAWVRGCWKCWSRFHKLVCKFIHVRSRVSNEVGCHQLSTKCWLQACSSIRRFCRLDEDLMWRWNGPISLGLSCWYLTPSVLQLNDNRSSVPPFICSRVHVGTGRSGR